MMPAALSFPCGHQGLSGHLVSCERQYEQVAHHLEARMTAQQAAAGGKVIDTVDAEQSAVNAEQPACVDELCIAGISCCDAI